MEGGDDRGHEIGSQRWRHAEPDGSCAPFGGAPSQSTNVSDLDKEKAGAISDFPPNWRQFDAAEPTFNQPDA